MKRDNLIIVAAVLFAMALAGAVIAGTSPESVSRAPPVEERYEETGHIDWDIPRGTVFYDGGRIAMREYSVYIDADGGWRWGDGGPIRFPANADCSCPPPMFSQPGGAR